ncbi:MAG: hypothetical protein D4R84_02670 [Rhodocyclaceae bacterium]|nr:MAG: hypothetical protein D4R84_02670 [Rhodocyclaceae bacterium]
MLAMMIVVLVVVGLSGGHMGMLGQGNPAPDNSSSSSDQKERASEHQGAHMGMMGHGKPVQDKSPSSSDQKGGASEHQH